MQFSFPITIMEAKRHLAALNLLSLCLSQAHAVAVLSPFSAMTAHAQAACSVGSTFTVSVDAHNQNHVSLRRPRVNGRTLQAGTYRLTHTSGVVNFDTRHNTGRWSNKVNYSYYDGNNYQSGSFGRGGIQTQQQALSQLPHSSSNFTVGSNGGSENLFIFFEDVDYDNNSGVYSVTVETVSCGNGLTKRDFLASSGTSNIGATQCSDGADNDGDGKVDALVNVSTNAGSRTFNTPWEIREFTQSLPGITPIPGPPLSGDDGSGAPHNDQVTAEAICNLAGFSNAQITATGNYHSCGDNTIGVWNSARNDFDILPACGRNDVINVLICSGMQSACSDGIDNDGDGNIDGFDNGCASINDNSELEHDPDCSSPTDTSEGPATQCNDGLDNDNDGKIDALDETTGAVGSRTFNTPWEIESFLQAHPDVTHFPQGYAPHYDQVTADAVCRLAGFSNATMTREDYYRSCGDNQIAYWDNAINNLRIVNACQRNRQLAGLICQGSLSACNDGIDNDGDGSTDGFDNGCASPNDRSEVEHDPECTDFTDDSEAPDIPATQCNDGLDNDNDGKVDFPADPGCSSLNDGSEQDTGICPQDQVTSNVLVNCTGGGQLCNQVHSTSFNVQNPTALNLAYTVNRSNDAVPSQHCSSIRLHVAVNGQNVGTTEFLGWEGSGGPLSTNLNLGTYQPGTYNVTLQAEGRADGCNGGFLGSWGGVMSVTASQDQCAVECSDGTDNDGDGAVDFPNDFSCSSANDDDEATPRAQCQDGTDNDGDGTTDFPSDPGCLSQQDDNERGANAPACDNGQDDDNDGKTDFPSDPGCTGPSDNDENDPIPTADVTISKSLDGNAVRGGVVKFTVTAINNGPEEAMTVVISDPIPSGLTYNSGETTNGCVQNGNNILCNNFDLNNGEQRSFTIAYNIPTAVTCGATITNVATVSTASSDPNPFNNSDEAAATVSCNECSDGIDNDNDGAVDFPNDFSCSDENDADETNPKAQCQDGGDNDGDGTVDFPADFSCSSTQDNDETNPKAQCQDGIDNDNDGSVDFPNDFSCDSLTDNDETNPKAQCQDGTDNDGDGAVDFPSDVSCDSPNDNDETNPRPECNDGADNDGDGSVDFPNDFSCSDRQDDDETNPKAQCQDGIDNDNNGLTDHPNDPGCDDKQDNDESGAFQCNDTLDNDNDGLVDFPNDPGCESDNDNDENNPKMQITKTARFTTIAAGDQVFYDISVTNVGTEIARGVRTYDFYIPAQDLPFTFVEALDAGNSPMNNCTSSATGVSCQFGDFNPNQSVSFTLVFQSTPGLHCGETFMNQIDAHTNPQNNALSDWAKAQVNVICNQCSDGVDNDNDGVTDFPNDFSCDSPTDNDEANPRAQCQDGVDNDGDGAVDFPDDVSCDSNQDNDETNPRPECNDGADNDGDGSVDFPNDFSCSDRQDNDETNPKAQCQDGTDNDNDGAVDFPADFACDSLQDNNEGDRLAECQDGNDNDGNGLTDHPNDPGCDTPQDNDEDGHDPECSDGVDNDGDGATDFPFDFSCDSRIDNDETNPMSQCQDGTDNDGDSLIDENDPGCNNNQDNDESDATTECQDGRDNDRDGAVDFPSDFSCDSPTDDDETSPQAACQDGADNDGDNASDFPRDPGCSSRQDDDERNPAGPQCDNGIDDDNDGNIDFPADPDCSNPIDDSEESFANLLSSKTGPANARVGEEVNYTVTARNLGPDSAKNVEIRDVIPAGLTFNQAESSAGCELDGNAVVCDGFDLSRNQQRSFEIVFDVNLNAACGADITNVSTVSTSSTDLDSANNTSDPVTTSIACNECRDGIDNDNDGAIDFPADFACDSIFDDDEGDRLAECQDGTDNDNNGLTDFPADPGCDSPQDNNEDGFVINQCSDGIDNDNDGAIDFPADFSCSSANDNDETNPKAQCQDGSDNDGDGQVDFPADPGCTSLQDNSERELNGPVCDNTLDDDNDGKVDFPADPGCTGPSDNDETDALPQADLSVSKTGPATVARGGTVTYTLTALNNGPDTATNVVVADPIPAGLSFNAGASDNDCVLQGNDVLCNNLTLNNGQSKTYTVVFDVSNGFTCGGTILNSASVSTSAVDPNSGNNQSQTVSTTVTCNECSDGIDNDNDGAIDFPADFSCSSANDDDESNPLAQCQDGIDNDGDNLTDFPTDPGCQSLQDNEEFNQLFADLSVTKAGPVSVSRGGTVVYTISATNLGPHTANNVVVTDTIPAGLNFNAGASDNDCVQQGNDILCNNLTLTNGQSKTYTVAFDVPNTFTCGGTIQNSASVSTSSTDNNSGNNQSQTVSTTVTCNECSDGLDNDNDGAIDFPADFSCSSANDNDETNPKAQCQDGGDNDGDGQVDFPADPGCTSLQDNSERELNGPVCDNTLDDDNDGKVDFPADPGCTGPSDNDEADPIPEADLTVAKSGDTTAERGGQVTYVLEARNAGPDTAFNAKVSDVVPAGLTFNAGLSDTGCSLNGGTVECNSFDLLSGELKAFTVVFDVQSTVACNSTIQNSASISADTLDPNTGNNQSITVSTQITCRQCSDGLDNDNDGAVDFPADFSCSTPNHDDESSPLAQCQDTFDNDGDGTIDFPADPDCDSNQDNDETGEQADLEIQIKNNPDTVRRGDQAVYIYSVINHGPTTASNVGITMPVPNGWIFNSLLSGQNCAVIGGDVKCNNVTLLDEENEPFTVVFDVPLDASQCGFTAAGTTTATSTATETNLANNDVNFSTNVSCSQCNDELDNDGDGAVDFPNDFSCQSNEDDDEATPLAQCQDSQDNDNDGTTDFPADPDCDSAQDNDEDGALADLAITLQSGPTTVEQGAQASYSYQVVNNGPTTAANVRIEMPTPNGWTINTAASDARCGEVGGTVQCNNTTLLNGENTVYTIVYDVPMRADQCNMVAAGDTTVSSTAPDPVTGNNAAAFSTTVGCTECQDGLDNDNDGAVDFPNDFSCSTPVDDDETLALAACQDGEDNDDDGTTDFPADPDCDSLQDNDEDGALADLEIEITNQPTTVGRGESAVFTYLVTNNGPTTAANVGIEMPVPTGWTFNSLLSGQNCGPIAGDKIYCNNITLLKDEDEPFTIVFDVPETATCGSTVAGTTVTQSTAPDPVAGNNSVDFSTQVTCNECSDGLDNDNDGAVDFPADFSCSTPNHDDESSPLAQCQDTFDNDGDGTIDFPADPDCDSNQDNDETGEQADLEIQIKNNPDTVRRGDQAVYIYSVINHGPTTASNVGITMPVPNGWIFNSLLSGQNCAVIGGDVKCNNVTLLDEENEPFTVVFDVPLDASQCGFTAAGTTTATSTATETNLANNDVNFSTNVSCSQCNDELDNDGDGAVDFPNDFSCQSNEDDDEATPLAQCQDSQDNDNDGTTDFPADPDCDSAQDNDEDGALADLAITLQSGPTTVEQGAQASYSYQVVNNGPTTAANVRIEMPTPNGWTINTAASDARCGEVGGTVQCNNTTLLNGENTVYTIVYDVPMRADQCNMVAAGDTTVSSTAPDPVTGNNAAAFSTTVGCTECQDGLDNDNDGAVDFPNDFSCSTPVDDDETLALAACQDGEDNDDDGTTDFPADPDCDSLQDNDEDGALADLEIEITNQPTTVGRGESAVFTYLVTNNGPTTAANVGIEMPVPTGWTFNSLLSGQNCGPIAGDKIYCNNITLLKDEDEPFTIVFDVPETATCGSTVAGTTVTQSTAPDPVAGNNSVDFSTQVTCNECSDGLDNDNDGAVDFPADFSCQSPTDEDEATPLAECQDGQDNDNDSLADFPADPHCDSLQDNDEGDSIADLSVTKTGSSSIMKGETIVYTITATNAGPGRASNVRITDPVPNGLMWNAAQSDSNCVQQGQGTDILCNNVTLEPNTSHTFKVAFTAPDSVACNSVISNFATVSSSDTDPNPANNQSAIVQTTVTCAAQPQCSDGQDNDNDGAVDFPADFSCQSADDNDEATPLAQCQDGQDNDNDGTTDFPSDPGCTSLQDNDEREANGPACDNRQDDDNDNLTDFPNDPGCSGPSDNDETDAAQGADLSIVKTGSSSILRGQTLVYKVVVTNAGPDTATNVTVSDNIPSGLMFDPASSDNTCVEQGGDILCNNVTLAPNASHTFMIGFTVSATAACQSTISNTASVSASSTDPNSANNQSTVSTTVSCTQCSDSIDNDNDGAVDFPTDFSCQSADDNDEATPLAQCQDGQDNDNDGQTDFPADTDCSSAQDNNETGAAADLMITKTGTSSVLKGATIQYAINVHNDGPGTANNVTVIDPVPAGLTFNPAISSVNCVLNGGNVLCDNVTLAQSGSQTFTVGFTVNSTATCGGTISNTASVSSSTTDPNPANNQSAIIQSTVTCPVAPECSDGQDNDGDGAVDFPTDVSCSAASDDDETNPKAQCQDGLDNDNDGLIDHPNDPGCDSTQDNDEFNQTSAPQCSDTLDNDNDGHIDFPADPGCTSAADNDETDPATGEPNVTLLLADNKDPVEPNETFNYIVTVTNLDATAGVKDEITLSLDNDVTYITSSNNGSHSNGIVTWTNISLPASGQVTLTASVRVKSDTRDGEVLKSIVFGSPSDDELTLVRTSDEPSSDDLRITITDDVDPVRPGRNIEYTIKICNESNDRVTTDVRAFLDNDTEFVDASDSGDEDGSDEVLWEDIDIFGDDCEKLTLEVEVDRDARDGDTLRLEVRAGNDEDTERTLVRDDNRIVRPPVIRPPFNPPLQPPLPPLQPPLQPELPVEPPIGVGVIRIEKSADRREVQPGSVLSYTVTVRNNGGVASNIRVEDRFTAGALNVEDAGGGTPIPNGIAWTIPTMGAGESRVLRYRVRVSPQMRHGQVIINNVSVQGNGLASPANDSVQVRVLEALPQTGAANGFTRSATAASATVRTPSRVQSANAAQHVPFVVWTTIITMGMTAGSVLGRKFLL